MKNQWDTLVALLPILYTVLFKLQVLVLRSIIILLQRDSLIFKNI